MITILIAMPADTLSRDKYMVCSIDSLNDDISSDLSDNTKVKDAEYVDLKSHKLNNELHVNTTSENTTSPLSSSSPVPSTVMSDRWVSYWSKRERCCCFWNFLLTVSLIVAATVLVLVTKGIVDLNQSESNSKVSNQKLLLANQEATMTTTQCATPKPMAKECRDESCVRLSSELLSRVNLSADPCTDFYNFACGGFVANTKLSWTAPRRRTNPDVILQKYMDTISDVLSDDVDELDDTYIRTVKNIYKLCAEKRQPTRSQVKEVIDSLGGMEFYGAPVSRNANMSQLLSHVMLNYGVSPLFKIIRQPRGKIGIINRFSDSMIETLRREEHFNKYRFLKPSDYIYRNEETDEVLQSYKNYISDFLFYVMQLDSSAKSDKRFTTMVDDIFHMDVYVNRVLYTEDTANLSDGIARCERPMSFADLHYHFNYNISWREVLTSILGEIGPSNNYTICFVSLSTGLKDVLAGFSYTSLKRYIIFSTLIQSDLFDLFPSATPKFDNDQWSNSAFPSYLTGQLDCVCIQRLSQYIPLSSLFKHRISDTHSAAVRKVFAELNKSIENLIDNMYWVPIIQKQHLLGALNSLSVRLSWKDQFDISSLVTAIDRRNETNSYFIVMKQMIKYWFERYYAGKLYKTDIETVTELSDGILNISPSVIEPPFFYGLDIKAALYGGLGTVLAQAMSETFDIDALLRFLTEDKIDHRVALTIAFRLQCLVDEYNKYELLSENDMSVKVRGDLTKNSNFKDSLALRVAYNAYEKYSDRRETTLPALDLTQDQLFFVAYAQTMCEAINTRGTTKYYVETEVPHVAPGKYRVLGTLSNYKKFSDAFSCKKGMAMNAENKCSLF